VAVGRRRVASEVGGEAVILAVQVAGKVPGHFVGRVVRDARVVGGDDDVETVLVDVLKEEAGVFSTGHPVVHVDRAGRPVELGKSDGVLPAGKVIVVPVDHERAVVDLTSLDA
jgi:hypothetical protein